jgi:hypothetical protein
MSEFENKVLELNKAFREAQRLHEIARQLFPLAAQAGPEEKEVLAAILQTLHIAPEFEEAPSRGQELEARHKIEGEKLGTALRKLATVAHHRSALLAAKPDPARVRVIDFGPNAVQVFIQLDQPPATKETVYGLYDRLPPDHPIRNQLTRGDCPTRDSVPIVYLGRPVQGLDGHLYPAADYPIAQALSWTIRAGRQEREIEERRKWDEDKAEQERKERAKKIPTIEQMAALVESLMKEVSELKAR